MNDIMLYRNRFIPNETVLLKDDTIIEFSEDYIITKWNVLKPRNDFSSGISYYLPKRGFKISKFFDNEKNLVYWYCDIIRCEKEGNKYIFTDLLADVIIYPDGRIKVMDIGEISQALKKGIIDIETACEALEKLDELLNEIYSGNFEVLADKIIKRSI